MSVAAKSFNSYMQPNGLGVNLGKAAEERFGRIIDFDALNQRREILKDANYMITGDEITAIKSTIQHVLRHELVTPKIVSVNNIGKGMLKYEYHAWNDIRPPRYTLDFSRSDAVIANKADSTLELIGFDYDMHLTMPQIDLYSNANRKVKFTETLRQGSLYELTASLAQYREWSLFRGTDIPNMDDLGKKGMINHASVQDGGAVGLGGDDDCTAAGDVYDAAIQLSNKLINSKFKPPYSIHLTPGLLSQALKNKEGTPKVSDYSLIAALGREEGMPIFSSIEMNPFLIDSETETNSTAAIMVCKPGVENFEVIESYGLGYYPLPSLDLGIDGKLLWMGGMAMYQPTSVVISDAITINTL